MVMGVAIVVELVKLLLLVVYLQLSAVLLYWLAIVFPVAFLV